LSTPQLHNPTTQQIIKSPNHQIVISLNEQLHNFPLRHAEIFIYLRHDKKSDL